MTMRAVVLRQLDRLVHALEHPAGHPPVAPAGEADLHALLVELVAPAHEQRLVEVHEVAHLVGRAAPVLGGEGVEGDPLDADLEGAVDHIEQGGLAGGVALGPGQPAGAGPATVAVHDAGDVDGDAGEVELGRDRVGRLAARCPRPGPGRPVPSLGAPRVADGGGHPTNLPRRARGARRVRRSADRGARFRVEVCRTPARRSGSEDQRRRTPCPSQAAAPRPDVTDMFAVHGVFRDTLGAAPRRWSVASRPATPSGWR